jgi:hypothetical protein
MKTKYAFDSSDDEVVELRSRTKKSTINNEETKEKGYLLNILKIFRHLQRAEPENFEEEFNVSTSIAIHDFASRLLRSSKIYNKYKEIKSQKFGIKYEEYTTLISELKSTFLPIVQKYVSCTEISNFGAKVLYNFTFDHTCTLAPGCGIDQDQLKELKKDLLEALKSRGFSQESKISEILAASYSDSLSLENAQNSADNPHFFISLLLDIRNIKNTTKASIISSLDSFSSATHLQFPSLGTGPHRKKMHTTSVSTQTSNSKSKVTNITTYNDLLSKLPTSIDEAQLLKVTILDIINSKAKFPLNIDGNWSYGIIAKIQNLSSDLTHLFFVECTRNHATIITFPMWLELWASDPAKYLNSFPMAIKGAVASARQIHDEFAELIFQPIFLDLDSANARDADQLLTPEYQLIMNWCAHNNIKILATTLKELALTFKLETKMKIEPKYMTAGDLLDIFSAAGKLFPEHRYKQQLELLKKCDREMKIPASDSPAPKVYDTRSNRDEQKLLSAYNTYIDISDKLSESVQSQKKIAVLQEIDFVHKLFLLIEQKMLDWYSLEVPENLRIGDLSVDFVTHYFTSPKGSPFKKQKRVREESEESDYYGFPEMWTSSKQHIVSTNQLDEHLTFHETEDILGLDWGGEELKSSVGNLGDLSDIGHITNIYDAPRNGLGSEMK